MNNATVDCNLDDLSVFVDQAENPWNLDKINHLFRRAGFGISIEKAKLYLNKEPQKVVDELISKAKLSVPSKAPDWAFWDRLQFTNSNVPSLIYRENLKEQFVKEVRIGQLRDRLTLFWSNHFVTEDDIYEIPSYMFQYYNLLQFHSIKNFKDFVKDIGLNSAMLIYLNGADSTKASPNENYARELYELFTLGVNNGYTQSDIKETARAFTGWNVGKNDWVPITFNQENFDNGAKEIFGYKANMDYYGVIELLFKSRTVQISEFICSKIYKYFVSPEEDKKIIKELASILRRYNFNIEPVLTTLLKSKHFFDINNFGTIFKSPLELQISFFNELDIRDFSTNFPLDKIIKGNCEQLGQKLFSPTDVSGWEGDTKWINSSTLSVRWKCMENLLWSSYNSDKNRFRNIAKAIIGGNSRKPELVVNAILDYFVSGSILDTSIYESALVTFKSTVPQNYFDDERWSLDFESAPYQVYLLLSFIIKIPEFQIK